MRPLGTISALLSLLVILTGLAMAVSPVSAGTSFSHYPDAIHVVPGGSALFSLSFANNGTTDSSFSVDMVSMDPRMSWHLIFDNQTVKSLSVPPGSSVSAILSISTSSTMPVGTYDFSLSVSGSDSFHFNGSVVVETPVLSLSQPEVVMDGDYVTFNLNITAIGNVSAQDVVVSLVIDGKPSDSVQLDTVAPDSPVPVSIRGSMNPGTHTYNITAVTMDGYSPVSAGGEEVIPEPSAARPVIPYMLLILFIFLGAVSQVVRVRRKRARIDRRSSGRGMLQEAMLRMDSGEEVEE